jgi:predicted GIY-YIG superfamily endonuclease
MEIKYTEKYEWNTHTKKSKTYYSIDTEEVNNINRKIIENDICLADIYINIRQCSIRPGNIEKNSTSGYVYTIKNICNNKIYIGRTINPISRIYDHIFKQGNNNLKDDMIIYGLKNFYCKIEYVEEYKNIEMNRIKNTDKDILYNILTY